MRTIKVLSYNIHKGFAPFNLRFNLSHLKRAIRGSGAELVFLQEVLGSHIHHFRLLRGRPVSAQFEYLADRIWSHYAYGKNAVNQDGHHGNAILSKFPFLGWENIDITVSPMERRGLLHGEITIPPVDGEPVKGIHVICVHLDLFESGRQAQVERICDRISSHIPAEAPLVLAGDFNDWTLNVSGILKERLGLREVFLETTGTHARTFPAWFPVLRLDRIYFRGLNIKKAARLSSPLWRRLSDHSPVLAEFEIY